MIRIPINQPQYKWIVHRSLFVAQVSLHRGPKALVHLLLHASCASAWQQFWNSAPKKTTTRSRNNSTSGNVKNDVFERRPLNFGNSQFPTTFRNLVKFVENFHSFSSKTPYGNPFETASVTRKRRSRIPSKADLEVDFEHGPRRTFEGLWSSRVRKWLGMVWKIHMKITGLHGEKRSHNQKLRAGIQD